MSEDPSHQTLIIDLGDELLMINPEFREILSQLLIEDSNSSLSSSSLEAIKHFPRFIATKEANEYFFRLLALPWVQKKWALNRTLPRLVYRYGDDNQKIEVLEELSSLIEYSLFVQCKSKRCLVQSISKWE